MEGQHPQAVTGDRITGTHHQTGLPPRSPSPSAPGTVGGRQWGWPGAAGSPVTEGNKWLKAWVQRPPRIELRSQMCPGLLSPIPAHSTHHPSGSQPQALPPNQGVSLCSCSLTPSEFSPSWLDQNQGPLGSPSPWVVFSTRNSVVNVEARAHILTKILPSPPRRYGPERAQNPPEPQFPYL